MSTSASSTPSDTDWSLKHPYSANLTARYALTTAASAKNVQHLEIDVGAELNWTPGDSLGVLARNHPELIELVLEAAKLPASAPVSIDGAPDTLGEALAVREISRIPKKFIQLVAERSESADFSTMLEPQNRNQLSAYTSGRDMLDVLDELAGLEFSANDLVEALRPLPPRLYSIASSQSATGTSVHLTVGVVTWESEGRLRHGVASTWLGSRITPQESLPCYVHAAKKFRLPDHNDTPIIMIGPGTGIAPFRAYLQERSARQAKGRNWLFFGEQHRASDYLYQDQLESWHNEGFLTRLDTAFSRDQAHKIYVQHLMWDQRQEFWSWLQNGAHLYVCGDALRMAKDVDETLHRIASQCGGLSDDDTKAWVKALKKDGRYQRDVYAV